LVAADGMARQVADGLAFPNGMLVTANNATLIVAESYAKRLSGFDIASDGSLSGRRVWGRLASVHCKLSTAWGRFPTIEVRFPRTDVSLPRIDVAHRWSM